MEFPASCAPSASRLGATVLETPLDGATTYRRGATCGAITRSWVTLRAPLGTANVPKQWF